MLPALSVTVVPTTEPLASFRRRVTPDSGLPVLSFRVTAMTAAPAAVDSDDEGAGWAAARSDTAASAMAKASAPNQGLDIMQLL
jgi:hypothetical protein